MTFYHFIGALLVASPLIFAFFMGWKMIGLLEILGIFALISLLFALFYCGAYLLTH